MASVLAVNDGEVGRRISGLGKGCAVSVLAENQPSTGVQEVIPSHETLKSGTFILIGVWIFHLLAVMIVEWI